MDERSHRFLLKVWREPGPQREWHAALRDVTDGSLHEFTAVEALVGYLTSLGDDGTAAERSEEEGR